jgi:hypothetical protein
MFSDTGQWINLPSELKNHKELWISLPQCFKTFQKRKIYRICGKCKYVNLGNCFLSPCSCKPSFILGTTLQITLFEGGIFPLRVDPFFSWVAMHSCENHQLHANVQWPMWEATDSLTRNFTLTLLSNVTLGKSLRLSFSFYKITSTMVANTQLL